jgi:hypothetical protein
MNNSHEQFQKRIAEIEALADTAKLVEIACTDESPRARLLAISKLEEDSPLMQVVERAEQLDVRLMAVERMSSQERIVEVLRAPENMELIGICFSKITDRKLIEGLAEDTSCNPVVRRLAVEHYANEGYLAEAYEARTGRKSKQAVEAVVQWHGGGLRGVHAIGRFKGSPKALKSLGTIARGGGEAGELAVEYLCKALGSANPKLSEIAADELAALEAPELIAAMILALDDPKIGPPLREVLARIDTSEARAALGKNG